MAPAMIQCPTVKINIQNNVVEALIDTGSEITALSQTAYDRLTQEFNCQFTTLPVTNMTSLPEREQDILSLPERETKAIQDHPEVSLPFPSSEYDQEPCKLLAQATGLLQNEEFHAKDSGSQKIDAVRSTPLKVIRKVRSLDENLQPDHHRVLKGSQRALPHALNQTFFPTFDKSFVVSLRAESCKSVLR